MLDQVRAHMLMGELPGHILIVYPLIPAKIFAAKRSTIVSSGMMPGLMPVVDGKSVQNDDESSQEDNFDDEGQLPEVVTKMCTTMTTWERQGALAKDRFTIDNKLGQHDLTRYVPQSVTISHKIDGNGNKCVERALLLVKQQAVGGNQGKLEFANSTLLRDGVYIDVNDPTDFVNVSKKFSMQCRKSQTQGWKTEGLTVSGRGYVPNKAARGQLGSVTYYALIQDLVKNCDTPCLLINDFMAGVGEIGAAALDAKTSAEAVDAGVQVCYWGIEDRRLFAEVARANICTKLGQAFLENKLVIEGLTPVHALASSPTASGIAAVV